MSFDHYEIIPLDTFNDNLEKYFRRDKARILDKLKQNLENIPNRYEMLKSPMTIAGMKLVGLRHIKVGVSGYKGGSVTKFRICKECLDNGYYITSKVKCEFCDKDKPYRVILFDILPRSFGYNR